MRVAVLGGGIGGLTAAWALHQKGADVTVFEAGDRLGGKIWTRREGPYLLEMGPHAIMPSYERLYSAVSPLGLSPALVEAGANGKKRFIYHRGKPRALPTGLLSAATTPLLGPLGKLRVLTEPFRARGPQNESIADFFARRMGPQVVDRLIDPFISGVYAGDKGVD